MLREENRLRKKTDIERVQKSGENFFGNYFVYKFISNGINFSRFAFVISSKISKRANVRNKLKRQLRALIRERIKDIREGYDVLILAKTRVTEVDYQTIKKDIDLFLNKCLKK